MEVVSCGSRRLGRLKMEKKSEIVGGYWKCGFNLLREKKRGAKCGSSILCIINVMLNCTLEDCTSSMTLSSCSLKKK